MPGKSDAKPVASVAKLQRAPRLIMPRGAVFWGFSEVSTANLLMNLTFRIRNTILQQDWRREGSDQPDMAIAVNLDLGISCSCSSR